MVLFIALPFIGGWVGYTYAPERVVEIERVRVIPQDNRATTSMEARESAYLPNTATLPKGLVHRSEALGVSFEVPSDWIVEPHPSAGVGYPKNSIWIRTPELERGTAYPDTPVMRGAYITLFAELLSEKYDQSIWNPEAFLAFHEKMLDNCSNCIMHERINIGETVGLLSVSSNAVEWRDDPAGGTTVSVMFIHDGRVFDVKYTASSESRDYKAVLARLIETIEVR